MNIVNSLRFRILAACTLFALLTSICYTLVGLKVLDINDDELFNWHIADRVYRWLEEYDSPGSFAVLEDRYPENIVLGNDRDMLLRLSELVEEDNRVSLLDSLSLEISPLTEHKSASTQGYRIYELRVDTHKYHIVKAGLPQEGKSLYYFIDVSGYKRLDVFAAQGTYFFLIVSALLCIILGCLLGARVARYVISPLTRLTVEIGDINFKEHTSLHALKDDYYPDEVGQVAQTINQLMQHVTNMIEREKAFSRDVSHELRTPNTSSQMALELAIQFCRDREPKLIPILERIERANKDVTHLIETFLYMGRDKIDPTSLVFIELHALTDQVIERNKYLLGSNSVCIKNLIDTKLSVKLPKQLLLVVINNLIRNAFQYTANGEVTVKADASFITVSDTGKGFNQPEIQRLMQPYQKDQDEGMGLGLSIVRRICLLTQWQLEITSTSNRGSQATVRF